MRSVRIGPIACLTILIACTTGNTSIEPTIGETSQATAGGTVPTGAFEVESSAAGLDAVVDADGTLHLVWWEGTSITGARLFVRAVPSGSAGAVERLAPTFEVVESDPELLLTSDGTPCLAFEAWADAAEISTEGLYLSCRSDGTWGAPALIEQQGVTADYAAALDPSGTPRAIHISPPSSIAFGDLELGDGSIVQSPSFEIDGGGAYHAIWQSLGTPGGLVHRASTDAGITWSEPELLNGGVFFTRPAILSLAPNGTVNVFFARSDLLYRAGSPGAFGPLETIAEVGNAPSVGTVAGDGTAHAFWADAAGIRHAERTDGTWSQPVIVPGTEGSVAEDLATAVSADGRVGIAWIEPGEPPTVRYAAA